MAKIIRFARFVKSFLAKAKKNAPLLNVDITSKCNLNCEHCYWKKTYNSKKELSEEEWKQILLDYKNKGCNSIVLTGGEPTLRVNLIKAVKDLFVGVSIVSNGIIKVPEDIQMRIFISIDGPKYIHDKIRGVEVFDKIMKNIQGDKRVILIPTLSTTNYRYIEELIDLARKAEVDGITFSMYTSHKEKGDPLVLEGDKLDWTINKLNEVRIKNKDIVLLSPLMIKLFKTKEHSQNCFMKDKSKFLALDANNNIKSPCTLGKGVVCSTCGCIVPVMAHAMHKIDIPTWLLFDKIYPERYYGS